MGRPLDLIDAVKPPVSQAFELRVFPWAPSTPMRSHRRHRRGRRPPRTRGAIDPAAGLAEPPPGNRCSDRCLRGRGPRTWTRAGRWASSLQLDGGGARVSATVRPRAAPSRTGLRRVPPLTRDTSAERCPTAASESLARRSPAPSQKRCQPRRGDRYDPRGCSVPQKSDADPCVPTVGIYLQRRAFRCGRRIPYPPSGSGAPREGR